MADHFRTIFQPENNGVDVDHDIDDDSNLNINQGITEIKCENVLATRNDFFTETNLPGLQLRESSCNPSPVSTDSGLGAPLEKKLNPHDENSGDIYESEQEKDQTRDSRPDSVERENTTSFDATSSDTISSETPGSPKDATDQFNTLGLLSTSKLITKVADDVEIEDAEIDECTELNDICLNLDIYEAEVENTEDDLSSNNSTSKNTNQTSPKSSDLKGPLFRCRKCKLPFHTRPKLWEHLKIHIPPEKRLSCNFCSFITEHKHHMEYHRNTHSGHKPYHCEFCDYSCGYKSMLKSHMKTHSDKFYFYCGSCDYKTKHKCGFNSHLKKNNHVEASVSIGNSNAISDSFQFRENKNSPHYVIPKEMSQQRISLPLPSDANSSQIAVLKPETAVNTVPYQPHFTHNYGIQHWSSTQPTTCDLNAGMAQRQFIFICPICKCWINNVSTYNLHMWHHQQSSYSNEMLAVQMERNKCLDLSLNNTNRASQVYEHSAATPSNQFRNTNSVTYRLGTKEESTVMPYVARSEVTCLDGRSKEERNVAKDVPENIYSSCGSTSYCVKLNYNKVDSESCGKNTVYGDLKPSELQSFNHKVPDNGASCSFQDSTSHLYTESNNLSRKSRRKGIAKKLSQVSKISPNLNYQERRENNLDINEKNRDNYYSLIDMNRYYQQFNLNNENLHAPISSNNFHNTQINLSSPQTYREIRNQSNRDLSGSNHQSLTSYNHHSEDFLSLYDNRSQETSMETSLVNWDNERPTVDGKEPCEVSTHSSVITSLIPPLIKSDEEKVSEAGLQIKESSPEQKVTDKTNSTEEVVSEAKCSLTVNFPSSNQKLEETFDSDDIYTCNYCEMAFRDCVLYTLHMGYHGHADPFTCNMCGHQNKDKVEFFLHIARKEHL